jgi:NADH-quinone oxidoreductase subunit E
MEGKKAMTSGADQAVRERVREVLRGYVGHKGALLMALLDVQYQLSYIPDGTVEDTAEILGYSYPEVWGVLTFYSDFKLGKQADRFIDVCIDTPCHVGGARRIWRELEDLAAARPEGEPLPFELRRISCPRLCHQAPVVAFDMVWHGQMTPEKAKELASGLSPQPQRR